MSLVLILILLFHVLFYVLHDLMFFIYPFSWLLVDLGTFWCHPITYGNNGIW